MMRNGILICFVGIDGSGKTTQAELLIEWLGSKGIQSVYVWSRGQVQAIRRLLLFLGRKALGTSEQVLARNDSARSQYLSKKSRLMNHWAVRTVWSAMVRVEHIVQINRDIRENLRSGRVVVCDRYLWDSTVDLAVLHHRGPEWLSNRLNRLMWRLAPTPAITFFIDIPPDEALQRKSDIPSHDYVQKRAVLYRHLAISQSMVVIDGCHDPLTIHTFVLGKVQSYLEQGRRKTWPG